MSIVQSIVNNKTADELANLGNQSNKLFNPGAHLFTIGKVYELKAENYDAIVIEGTTKDGSDFQHMEFLGKPKDDTQAEIDKAQAKSDRAVAMLARFAKAAGFKDLGQAVGTATVEKTDKGEATVFTKFAKKQLIIVTTTEIQPNKDGNKAFAVQVLDTMKFLDKSGKDLMGRDRLAAYDEEAKQKVEIKWGSENNPVCIQKLNEVKERMLGVASQPAATTGGMPTATQPAVTGGMPSANPATADDDDI